MAVSAGVSGTVVSIAAVFNDAVAATCDPEFVADSREHRAARFDRVSADSAHGVPGESVTILSIVPADSETASIDKAAIERVLVQRTTGISPASDSAAIIT